MTKVKIYSCFTFVFLLLASCGVDYGSKFESKELDIYYTKAENEEYAKKIAFYWKEHDLLGHDKQYIQLDEKNELLLLKIIPTEEIDPNTFSFDEMKLLIDLQDSLQAVVVPKRLEIVLSKNNFETLYNINN